MAYITLLAEDNEVLLAEDNEDLLAEDSEDSSALSGLMMRVLLLDEED